MYIEYLNECFECNFKTGKLFWKDRPVHHFKNEKGQAIFNGQFSGKEAGTVNGNYISVVINRKSYLAHRIVWCMYYGEFPSNILDHRNQNGFDNSIGNLRLSNSIHNGTNRKKREDNILGNGIHLKREKYQVQIQYNGKRYNKTLSSHKEALEYSIDIYKQLGFDENHYTHNKNLLYRYLSS